LRGFCEGRTILDAQEVTHANMKAVNTKDDPNNVAPHPIKSISVDGPILKARLSPASWNVIVTGRA